MGFSGRVISICFRVGGRRAEFFFAQEAGASTLKIQIQRNQNENENNNATGEATYGGVALRAPLAGSPAFAFVFVFIVVLLSVKFFGPQLIRENLKIS